MAIPKCKRNVFSLEAQELIVQGHAVETGYIGKDCEGRDFDVKNLYGDFMNDKRFDLDTV